MSKKPEKRQPNLLTLGFIKKPKISSPEPENSHPQSGQNDGPTDNPNLSSCKSEVDSSSSAINNDSSKLNQSTNDIAYYISKKLSDTDKYNILKNLWIPERSFKFPTRDFSNKKRSFQLDYIESNPWLCYSRSLDAAFCSQCFIFQQESGGGSGGSQKSQITTTGFSNWKKATIEFRKHFQADYHKTSAVFAENFISSYQVGVDNVTAMFQKHSSKEAEQNKKIFTSIVRSVIFLARQNIPFRGHRDHGKIILEQEVEHNDGNFRELLRHLALYYDDNLNRHLKVAPSNATYTSWNIQNQLIAICGGIVLNKLVCVINSAKCFAVMADETTDISTCEQLTVCVRHVQNEAGQYVVKEDFLGFSVVTDMTGAGLATAILKHLQNAGVDMRYLRGQTYDGAAAMTSDLVGVKTRIQNDYPLAVHTYCSNHCLNLIISSACRNKHIQNMLGVVKETISFFSRSAKRNNALHKEVESSNVKAKGLLSLCETRWVERHDALIRFADLLEFIVKILENIDEIAGDRESKSKASILLKSICSVEFLVSIHSAVKLLSISHPLSKILQDPQADLQVCYEQLSTITNVIQEIRENAEKEFNLLFDRALTICTSLEIEVKLPRLCKRQARENYEDLQSASGKYSEVETYFRRSIFIPFVDEFLLSLTSRFENHRSTVCPLLKLLPCNIRTCGKENLKEIFDFYETDINGPFCLLEGEVLLWKEKWKGVNGFPKTAVDTLQACDQHFFPIVHYLMKVLCTLPISVATAERSFSCLRRLKTYLRNTMGEDRLSSLAIINVHNDINIDVDQVLTEFKRSNRRIILP